MVEPGFVTEARAFYDALALDYRDRLFSDLIDRPVERAVLAAFAELVGPGARVADLGCGPGRITAHLAALGLDCHGTDISPVTVALARETFPALRFDTGSMTALDLPDASVAGLVCWYSLIHVPPGHRAGVLAELRRVLAPGGHLLLAFQLGDNVLNVQAPDGRRDPAGRVVALDFHRLSPDDLTTELTRAGFRHLGLLVRDPVGHDTAPQGFLLARG